MSENFKEMNNTWDNSNKSILARGCDPIALTRGWTLEEYRNIVRKYQGEDIQIIETVDESMTVSLLKNALNKI